jgi:hypothetical protein
LSWRHWEYYLIDKDTIRWNFKQVGNTIVECNGFAVVARWLKGEDSKTARKRDERNGAYIGVSLSGVLHLVWIINLMTLIE